MTPDTRRQFLRRATVAGLAVGLAGCSGSGGDGGDGGDSGGDGGATTAAPTTRPPHTPSEEPGKLAVGASTRSTGEEAGHQVTAPLDESVAGQRLESVAVSYPPSFSVDGVQADSVRALVGEEGSKTSEAPVGGVETTERDDASEVKISVEGTEPLSEAHTVVTEYEGVETPDRRGEYAVTATVNETATEVGTVTVSDETTPITDDFAESIAGWRVAGDAQGNSAFPNHVTDAGQPAPCLSAVDDTVGGVWYWVAPLKYLGDRSDYVGGTLSFSLRQSRSDNQFNAVDVAVLAEGGGGLVYDVGGTDTHPATDWSTYEVPLAAVDGWRYNPDGTQFVEVRSDYANQDPADESTFREVFGQVKGLYVRGEYVSGSDTGWLDGVAMRPP